MMTAALTSLVGVQNAVRTKGSFLMRRDVNMPYHVNGSLHKSVMVINDNISKLMRHCCMWLYSNKWKPKTDMYPDTSSFCNLIPAPWIEIKLLDTWRFPARSNPGQREANWARGSIGSHKEVAITHWDASPSLHSVKAASHCRLRPGRSHKEMLSPCICDTLSCREQGFSIVIREVEPSYYVLSYEHGFMARLSRFWRIQFCCHSVREIDLTQWSFWRLYFCSAA